MVEYKNWLKSAPRNLNSGLTIIKKIKNQNDYIILLGGNYIGNQKKYEMLGGRFEPSDKTALHTGIREFVEELFNIKLDINNLDTLVENLVVNEHLINNLTHKSETSISYFANFKTLELIYNFVYYGKYQIIKPLDFSKFMEKRNLFSNQCVKFAGLCEIDFISVVYLSKVHMLPLRKFTFNGLQALKTKLSL